MLTITNSAASKSSDNLVDKDNNNNNNNKFVIDASHTKEQEVSELDEPWHRQFFIHSGMALLCVFLAAIAAGMTMGLLSVEPMQLQIILNTNEADLNTEAEKEELIAEKKSAAAILPLVLKHHLLLVTLLLLNSIANEALPLFLDQVVPSWLAVILSVTLVLFFGEIIPSAFFTGPGQLSKAASMSGLVRFFMVVLYPISYPIAKLLDCCLGEEMGLRYRHAELKALVSLQHHRSHKSHEGKASIWEGEHPGLTDDEVTIIHGALAMKKLTVGDIMIPLNKVFMLSMDAVLDPDTMARIMASGHSRIPIYDVHPHNVRGVLLVKNLIVLNPEDRRKVRSLGLRKLLLVRKNLPLLEVLNEFQSARSHLAIVCDQPESVRKALKHNEIIPPHVHMAGCVALEDVLEKLIQEPIYDEKDQFSGSSVREKLDSAQKKASRMTKLRELVQQEKAKISNDMVKVPIDAQLSREGSDISESSSVISPCASSFTTLRNVSSASPRERQSSPSSSNNDVSTPLLHSIVRPSYDATSSS